MGRYIREVRLEQPIDVVSIVMDDFIYHNHFSRTDWNGEMVFYLKDSHKKERYMKWSYVDGLFHIEAWLKNSFGGETDLNGAGASRKEYRKNLEDLLETLRKTAGGFMTGGHIGSDPLHHDSSHADNHEVWRKDTTWQQEASSGNTNLSGNVNTSGSANLSGNLNASRSANTSGTTPGSGSSHPHSMDPEANSALIFAVLALVFGWIMPVLGVIFLVLSKKKEDYSSNPGAVKVIFILAIVFMVISFVGNFLLGYLGLLFI